MQTESSKSLHPLIWAAGIAFILVCGAGVAALMGWLPTPTTHFKTDTNTPPIAANTNTAPVTSQPTAVIATPPVKAVAAVSPPALVRIHHPHKEKSVQHEPSVAQANPAPVKIQCNECGTVESVRALDARGQGSGLGAVGGAVVGGVLGHQVGGGRGQDIATVAGVLGGAFAGNEIEKRVKSATSYEITVRLNDGSQQVLTQTTQPIWHAGDHVKIVNGEIISNN